VSQKHTFYIASSYPNKDNVNKLSVTLMNDRDIELWPTFPWWMYSQEEDKHPRHQGAVSKLEIQGAGNADLFIWLKNTRKGGWCELGAANYTSTYGGQNCIVMLIPESESKEYLPPMAYQADVVRKYVPDQMFKKPLELANVILEVYRAHRAKYE